VIFVLNTLSFWPLVVALCGAGVFNVLGRPATKDGFVHWGYPRWWCYVTGALELTAALMLAFPHTREWGLFLAAFVVVAATLTILRHREFSHLAPIGVFVALLVLGWHASSGLV
jgi:uncharacterized membrane protein YphA (DoxX/SURF4 family)